MASPGISVPFETVFRSQGCIAHVLLTRAPLAQGRNPSLARLACVRRAASVRSEPGSNSPIELDSCLRIQIRVHRRSERLKVYSRVSAYVLQTCYSDFKERPRSRSASCPVENGRPFTRFRVSSQENFSVFFQLVHTAIFPLKNAPFCPGAADVVRGELRGM